MDINELRNAFKKKETEGGNGENIGWWHLFYPFYKMEYEQTAEFRFLPDLDEENPLGFIVENRYHELQINGKKKKIACGKMYDEPCACCERSQKHYDEGDEKLGKSFWRKVDYIAAGLIISSPFDYPINKDENPARMVSIGPKLYKVIEAKIVKGDLDEMPYDMVKGYNFRINKTHQGDYADYTTSDFARKSTPVTENLLDKLELYDLKNYRYGKIEREQMEAMIEAFLTGRSYEDEKSTAASTGSPALDATISSPKSTQPAELVVEAVKAPMTEAPVAAVTTGKLSPQEILKRLKERQNAGN